MRTLRPVAGSTSRTRDWWYSPSLSKSRPCASNASPCVNALGSCSIVATTSYELTYDEGAGAGSPSSRGELRSAADAERIAKEAATSAASPNARRIVVEGGAAA